MQDNRSADNLNEVISDLNNYHINDDGLASLSDADFEDDSDLPRILIVTHVPDVVFESDKARVCFVEFVHL